MTSTTNHNYSMGIAQLQMGTQDDNRAAIKQRVIMTNATQKVMMSGGAGGQFDARRASEFFKMQVEQHQVVQHNHHEMSKSLYNSLAMTMQAPEQF